MDQKPSCPIPWTENHHVQKSCVKIMHKNIGGSAQPNIGSKTKISWGAAPDPIKWGYRCPSNPLLTMWKEYNTTQHLEPTDGWDSAFLMISSIKVNRARVTSPLALLGLGSGFGFFSDFLCLVMHTTQILISTLMYSPTHYKWGSDCKDGRNFDSSEITIVISTLIIDSLWRAIALNFAIHD